MNWVGVDKLAISMQDPDFTRNYNTATPSHYSLEQIKRQSRRDRTLAVLLGIVATYLFHPPFTRVVNAATEIIVNFIVSMNLFAS